MRIAITTDGGFTGRGIGGVTLEDAERKSDRIARAIERARPEQWREEYPARGADQVRYTLEIGERRVSWEEGAEIPADLRELFEAVWSAAARTPPHSVDHR